VPPLPARIVLSKLKLILLLCWKKRQQEPPLIEEPNKPNKHTGKSEYDSVPNCYRLIQDYSTSWTQFSSSKSSCKCLRVENLLPPGVKPSQLTILRTWPAQLSGPNDGWTGGKGELPQGSKDWASRLSTCLSASKPGSQLLQLRQAKTKAQET
jgi:hypothetical protein